MRPHPAVFRLASRRRGLRTACLWLAGGAAPALLSVTAMAQTPAPQSATPLLPPTQQYPGIQSEPLAPPPGLTAPTAATPQMPGVTTPASPQPPNVINPGAAPAAATPQAPAMPAAGAPGTTPPALPGQAPPGGTPGESQAAPGQPPAAAAPPPPNPWLPQGGAVVQVLDKPDAQSATLTIKVGQSATYRSLTITVKACDVRPPDMPPDATAFLVVTDSHAGQPGFSGWMLASDPSLNMMQNPIYDLRVKGCTP